jgi:hypothetical protein
MTVNNKVGGVSKGSEKTIPTTSLRHNFNWVFSKYMSGSGKCSSLANTVPLNH